MKCLYCRGEMERGSAPFDVDRAGYHLRLEGVPAWVCVQCGEPFWEASSVEAIQDMLRSVDAAAQRLRAPA
ncbi:YgiT-type zinc finger protein [bacterium]|nr:YgiT-type zinc finger protein [bacterium]